MANGTAAAFRVGAVDCKLAPSYKPPHCHIFIQSRLYIFCISCIFMSCIFQHYIIVSHFPVLHFQHPPSCKCITLLSIEIYFTATFFVWCDVIRCSHFRKSWYHIYVALPPSSVGEGVVFGPKQHKILGWLLAEFVRPFVLTYAATITWLDSGGQRSRSQQATAVKSCAHHISWTTWAMKLTAPTFDLIKLWLLKVKVTAGCWGGTGIHVDAGEPKLIF